MQPGAGRFAGAVGEAGGIAGFKIEQVDLKEGICRIAFALEDHPLPVGAEVAFARALTRKCKLPRAGDKLVRHGLQFLGYCGRQAGGGRENEQADHASNTPAGTGSVNQRDHRLGGAVNKARAQQPAEIALFHPCLRPAL